MTLGVILVYLLLVLLVGGLSHRLLPRDGGRTTSSPAAPSARFCY